MSIVSLTQVRGRATAPSLGGVPAAPYAQSQSPYKTTSTTSLSIGSAGQRVFTLASVYHSYLKGARVRATSTSSGAWMEGIVASYIDGALTVLLDRAYGSGTYTDWVINVAAAKAVQNQYVSAAIDATLVESHVNSNATFTLKTLLGEDPTVTNPIYFMSPLGYPVKIITPLSLTIPAGSDLGSRNNKPFRLWLFLLYEIGFEPHLAVAQTRGPTDNNVVGFPQYGAIIPATWPAFLPTPEVYSDKAMNSSPYVVLGFADYEAGLPIAGIWTASPTRIVLYQAGMALPGDTIQTAFADGFAKVTASTVIPEDNTIPQITEGSQWMTIGFTPSNVMSVIEINAEVQSGDWNAQSALFRVGQSNALQCTWGAPAFLNHRIFLGTITAETFTVRGGYFNATQISFNGNNAGASFFGGTFNSFMRLNEIMT